jgi:hypothetical protein
MEAWQRRYDAATDPKAQIELFISLFDQLLEGQSMEKLREATEKLTSETVSQQVKGR